MGVSEQALRKHRELVAANGGVAPSPRGKRTGTVEGSRAMLTAPKPNSASTDQTKTINSTSAQKKALGLSEPIAIDSDSDEEERQKYNKEREGEVHCHGNKPLLGAKEQVEQRTGAKIVSDLDDMSDEDDDEDDEDDDDEEEDDDDGEYEGPHVENGFRPTEGPGRQAAKERDPLPIIIPKFVPSSARSRRDGAQLGKQQV